MISRHMILIGTAHARSMVVALLCAVSSGCARDERGTGPTAPGARPSEALQSLLSRAETAFQDGDYAEAVVPYEQAGQIEPDESRITANLGICYVNLGMLRKAQTFLQAFLARHPEDVPARLLLARTLLHQGELGPGAAALREVLRTHPELLMVHYNLGVVAYRSRLYDEAEEHLKHVVEQKPDVPDAYYSLGLTYMALKRYPEAIASLEKAVQVDPNHVGARFNLANACARAGRLQDAAKQQAAYAELSGRSRSQQEKEVRIKASSQTAVQYLLDKKYPEALAEYQALAVRFPDHAPIYDEIGQLFMRLGRREEAFEALKKATSLDPKLSRPHYLLAGLYLARGDQEASNRELTTFASLQTIPEEKLGY